ncbi:hypothetical protein Holit_03398 [Hollandina sp. SP2]
MNPVIGSAFHLVFPPVGFSQTENRIDHPVVIRGKTARKGGNPGFSTGRKLRKSFRTVPVLKPLIEVYVALG